MFDVLIVLSDFMIVIELFGLYIPGLLMRYIAGVFGSIIFGTVSLVTAGLLFLYWVLVVLPQGQFPAHWLFSMQYRDASTGKVSISIPSSYCMCESCMFVSMSFLFLGVWGSTNVWSSICTSSTRVDSNLCSRSNRFKVRN